MKQQYDKDYKDKQMNLHSYPTRQPSFLQSKMTTQRCEPKGRTIDRRSDASQDSIDIDIERCKREKKQNLLNEQY